MNTVKIGLEQIAHSLPEVLRGQRLGLLCNAASLDSRLIHARQLLNDVLSDQLRALFSPQHGFFAEKQDNMIESRDRRDPILGIPIYSLYSHTRVPSAEMFQDIDVLIVDLQDVGTRVYTFIYTMSYCLEAARGFGKKVIVLDRPNPIGGELIEGNLLDPAFSSFVGRYPIPMRHGLTIGELALLFNRAFGIDCNLEVIPMLGWRRSMGFAQTRLPWIPPSPNLPTATSALVYPGQVLWEGTNVSEGRGTTQPFELFGAPFIEPLRILDAIGGPQIPGATLRPVEFEPTANKWQGQVCRGFQIHVTDAARFRPYRTSLALLQAVLRCHRQPFHWKPPPYEYEHQRMPIDLILGDGRIRQRLEAMDPLDRIEASWDDALKAFDTQRKPYLLYPQ